MHLERIERPIEHIDERNELRLQFVAYEAEHVVDEIFFRPPYKNTALEEDSRKHVNAKIGFFAYFAKQRILQGLSRVNFSRRKSPPSTFWFREVSLEKKNIILRFYKRSNNIIATVEIRGLFSIDHDTLLFWGDSSTQLVFCAR
jgi:hypothetical protein